MIIPQKVYQQKRNDCFNTIFFTHFFSVIIKEPPVINMQSIFNFWSHMGRSPLVCRGSFFSWRRHQLGLFLSSRLLFFDARYALIILGWFIYSRGCNKNIKLWRGKIWGWAMLLFKCARPNSFSRLFYSLRHRKCILTCARDDSIPLSEASAWEYLSQRSAWTLHRLNKIGY